MPNQEMLDRMPEVSRETLAEALNIPVVETLADQFGATMQELVHKDCNKRIADLEAENERLRDVLDEIAWPLKDRPECAGFTVLLKTTADLHDMARAALKED